jgi:hypothetical protein
MEFTLPAKLDDKIRKSPHSGVDAKFVKINEEWGIKAYRLEYTRDEAYENQTNYHNRGWAPPVGESFQIGGWYCYSTRVAQVIEEPNTPYDEILAIEDKYQNEIDASIREMNEIGLFPRDMHAGNWGIYEGKLMPIDFGFG